MGLWTAECTPREPIRCDRASAPVISSRGPWLCSRDMHEPHRLLREFASCVTAAERRSALFRIPPRRVVAGQRPRKLRWPIALTRRALRGSPARFLASPLCSLSAIAASEAHMRRMLALMSQCKLDSGVREQCLKNGATARREHEAPPCARAPKGPSRSCSAPSHVNS